ncbi:carbohydrate-binding module family 13 protein, partial [Lactarius vividus]
IKSGQRYKIVNEKNKLVVDLSRADNKSIIGHDFHGGENQQWVIEKQVNGLWTIRSVSAAGGYQKYLCVEKTPDNGTHLVGLDQPQFWDIEILPDPAKPSVNFRLCQWVRGTCFVADYPKDAGTGTNLQLWTTWGGKNQVWVLEECNKFLNCRELTCAINDLVESDSNSMLPVRTYS